MSPWIRTRRWDLTWLIGSAAIVPLVLAFVWAGVSSDAINLGVTVLIGGPHLFATYTATYLDPRFRRSHLGLLIAASIFVPAFVLYWTVANFQILLSLFIFAASVHVLHQNAYLTDIYRKRAGVGEPFWFRLVDYGLLMISIYPIAAVKLVHSQFLLGDIEILIPPFLKVDATWRVVSLLFALFAIVWIAKTAWEVHSGKLNRPKTLLIAATTAIAFVVPMAAAGERLELAFQSVNAWHSVQYLAIVWYLQRTRSALGMIESPAIAKLTGAGRFYGFCFLVTMGLLIVLTTLNRVDPLAWAGFHLSFKQYYYMCVLSCVLIHYVLDGYLFTVSNRTAAVPEQVPYAVPAAI